MIGLRTFRYLLDARPLPLYKVVRNLEGFYRTGFVSTAASEGVLALLRDGPRTTAQICEALDLGEDHGPMESWLDLGVCLGELRRSATGYRIRGSLSRTLSDPANDTALAFFQARVHVLNSFVLQTPALLREGRRIPPDPADGELVARSSRTVEPPVRPESTFQCVSWWVAPLRWRAAASCASPIQDLVLSWSRPWPWGHESTATTES